jgi:dihydrofolate synthase / folylpolyglutamate synthase
MTLTDWLARIERLHPREIELGLSRIREVARRLEVLSFSCPVVTVAGTNGKGSTVTLIERLARASGRRTALYTSPHILRFNERIRLNGTPVGDDELCDAFAAIEQARDNTPLTYFEFTTLAALWLFRRRQPDLVILEVGLGGRLDAVNLIDADVAVITSIGLDHQDWLGDDREQIGREKAGILRAGKPLLFAALDMPDSITRSASDGQAQLLRAGEAFGVDQQTIFWNRGGRQWCDLRDPVPLGRDNAAAAVQALALLDCLPEDIAAVVSFTALPGRCQKVQVSGVDWYFDVGHNREALARFRSLLPVPQGKRIAVLGMLADKPAALVMADFAGSVDQWLLASLDGVRARSDGELAALLPETAPAQCCGSVAAAVARAVSIQQAGDQVVVFGSFHTVAEAAASLSLPLE